jgi:hypothetical protein
MTHNNSKNQMANCHGLKVKTNVKASRPSTGNSGGGTSGSGSTDRTR